MDALEEAVIGGEIKKKADNRASRKAIRTMEEILFLYVHVNAMKNMDCCEKNRAECVQTESE